MRDKDKDLRDEVRSHLDMAVADRIARGESPRDAEFHARRELGNLSQINEATRDVWGRRWLERARQDVRYALRVFRRNPDSRRLPSSRSRSVSARTRRCSKWSTRCGSRPSPSPIRRTSPTCTWPASTASGGTWSWHASITNPIWEAIRDRQQALSGVFAWGTDLFDLTNGGETRVADGLWVSGGFFDVLGLHPAAGRLLGAADDRPGCAARGVLSYAFWQRTHAANPAVIGQAIDVDAHPVEVIGVAPRGFNGLEVGRSFDIAVPVCADPRLSTQ